jgi:hypothetical protein
MTNRSQRARQTLLAIAGPVAIGIASLFSRDPNPTAAVSLPAVWIGVLFVMLPTLYIGAALLGIAPSASTVGKAAASSLTRSSVVFLGLTPALVFMIGTSTELSTAQLLTSAVLGLGACLGLVAFYKRLFTSPKVHLRAVALFASWAAVSIAIGAHLFHSITTA